MYYFVVVVLLLLLSVMSTVNVICSNQTLILCMFRTIIIFFCIYWFSYSTLLLGLMTWNLFVFSVTYYSYHLALMPQKDTVHKSLNTFF